MMSLLFRIHPPPPLLLPSGEIYIHVFWMTEIRPIFRIYGRELSLLDSGLSLLDGGLSCLGGVFYRKY